MTDTMVCVVAMMASVTAGLAVWVFDLYGKLWLFREVNRLLSENCTIQRSQKEYWRALWYKERREAVKRGERTDP